MSTIKDDTVLNSDPASSAAVPPTVQYAEALIQIRGILAEDHLSFLLATELYDEVLLHLLDAMVSCSTAVAAVSLMKAENHARSIRTKQGNTGSSDSE